jgi:hypothetical protein
MRPHPDSYLLKAFLASMLLAVVMMVLALGLIYLFRSGTPLSFPLILVLAAISFVLSTSFFERYEVGSIMWSLILTLLSGGVMYVFSTREQSWEELLSGLAICMIVAMTLLNFLKRSLGEIEY